MGALILLLALSACAASTPTPSPEPVAKEPSTELLERVPADTPYLVWSPASAASPEPVNKALSLALLGLRDDLPDTPLLVEARQKGRPFVIYGLGVHPALRVELESTAAAQKAAASVAERVGAVAATFDRRAHWVATRAEDIVIIAADGASVSVARVPLELKAAVVPIVLGIVSPTESIARAGLVETLRERYGFGEAFVMVSVSSYLDVVLGLQRRLGSITGQFVARASVDRRCADGSQTFARSFPRVVAGFRERAPRSVSAAVVIESDPRLNKTLAGLRVPVPAVHATGANLTATFAVDVTKLANLSRGALAVLEPCKKHLPNLAKVLRYIRDGEKTWSPMRGIGLTLETVAHVFDPYMRGMVVAFTRDSNGLRGLVSRGLRFDLPSPMDAVYPLRGSIADSAAIVYTDVTDHAVGFSIGPTSPAPLVALGKSRSRRRGFITIRARTEIAPTFEVPFSLGDDMEFDVTLGEHGIVAELESSWR